MYIYIFIIYIICIYIYIYIYILKTLWKMTRNLCDHPAWLSNPTISTFCHSFYIIITLHNFFLNMALRSVGRYCCKKIVCKAFLSTFFG